MAASATTRRRSRTGSPSRGDRRSILQRRSPREWSLRGALALVAAVACFYSVTFSLAQVVAKRDPAMAHRLAPYDGRMTATYAAVLAGPTAGAADRRRGEALARSALVQDPSAGLAASTLGLNAQLRGHSATARRLFDYAGRLSRRNAQVQLWAIEDAVSRGDIDGALHQYDIALRVTPTLSEILYPVLATASGDAVIRPALIRTLAARPAWAQGFIDFVPANAPDTRATAVLIAGLRRAGVPVSDAARAGLIDALIARGQLEDAWRFYAAGNPRADRRRSRDPDFVADFQTPSQFDWVAVNDGTISSSIQRGDRGGVFDFAAPASAGGPMLRQLQVLPPGSYRLTARSSSIDQQPEARPYWVLTCPGERELGRLVLPNSNERRRTFSGTFQVPTDCPVQTLLLIARPSDAAGGLSGQIDRVELSPAE